MSHDHALLYFPVLLLSPLWLLCVEGDEGDSGMVMVSNPTLALRI